MLASPRRAQQVGCLGLWPGEHHERRLRLRLLIEEKAVQAGQNVSSCCPEAVLACSRSWGQQPGERSGSWPRAATSPEAWTPEILEAKRNRPYGPRQSWSFSKRRSRSFRDRDLY